MQNTTSILLEITNMNLPNKYEAEDMLIALYGYMDKKILADLIIEIGKMYE